MSTSQGRYNVAQLLGFYGFIMLLCSVKSKVVVDRIRNVPVLEHGDSVHWDPSTGSVYFVNIGSDTIHRYHPETDKHYSAPLADSVHVTFVIPIEGNDGLFAVGLNSFVGICSWDGLTNDTITIDNMVQVLDVTDDSIIAGKTDPSGRVWIGTAGEKSNPQYGSQGAIYTTTGGQMVIQQNVSSMGVPKGMTWSPYHTKFYVADNFRMTITEYNFKIDSDVITSKGTVILDFTTHNIKPDGMTIDTRGNLWVACTNSGLIMQIDPNTSTPLTQIQLPDIVVTSLAFGGMDLNELYVTTAKQASSSDSGSLYRVTNIGSIGFAGVSVKQLL